MAKLGLFDSGFGGLTIAKAVAQRLPLHDFVYIGDGLRAPYGDRLTEDIYRLTEQAVRFLFSQDCDLIIVACNTASAQALRKIQQNYLPTYAPNKRVLGVIIPAAEAAVQQSKTGRIGVMATDHTVSSDAFVKELKKLQSDVTVIQQACPMLVPLIEAGRHTDPAVETLVSGYVKPLLAAHIDTLILGCTHYELIKDTVQQLVEPSVKVLAEGAIVAERLADYLARHPELESRLSKNVSRQFFCTQESQRLFDVLASQFYGSPITAKRATLE